MMSFASDSTTSKQGERYLHPTEIRNFVASYISQVATTLEMREDPKRPAVFSWSGRGIDAPHEAVRQHLMTSGETTDLDWQLAGRLCRDTRAVFTFNGEVATSDHTVEFVSAHHPIVRAASAAFQAIDPPPAAGWLRTEATGATPGIYAFYIFRIQISGARSSLELEPVALEVDGAVASDVTDRLIPLITRAKANDRNPQGIVDADVRCANP